MTNDSLLGGDNYPTGMIPTIGTVMPTKGQCLDYHRCPINICQSVEKHMTKTLFKRILEFFP